MLSGPESPERLALAAGAVLLLRRLGNKESR